MRVKRVLLSVVFCCYATQGFSETSVVSYRGTSKLDPTLKCGVDLTVDDELKVLALDAYGYGTSWVPNHHNACSDPVMVGLRCETDGAMNSVTLGMQDLSNPESFANYNFQQIEKENGQLILKGTSEYPEIYNTVSYHTVTFKLKAKDSFSYRNQIETFGPLFGYGKFFECENLRTVEGKNRN